MRPLVMAATVAAAGLRRLRGLVAGGGGYGCDGGGVGTGPRLMRDPAADSAQSLSPFSFTLETEDFAT
jgi:hypothetical protein